MCDGLNKSLGGVNNLEPIVNEEENKLVIMDQNPLPKNDELRKLIKKKLIGMQDGLNFRVSKEGSKNIRAKSGNTYKNINFANE